MTVDDLVRRVGDWLSGKDADSDVVISSRARLARNIAAFPFSTRLDDEGKAELENHGRKALEESKVVSPGMYVDLFEASPLDRRLLVERHLISKEHEQGASHRGVQIGEDERVSIMLGEEDHLRIQVLLPGMAARDAWGRVDAMDTALESHIEYAFHPEFGYLTVCPTNVGTGLRVSVMVHLPALVITQQIDKVFGAVSRLNMAVRGLYGEGTEAVGHFYQISNQASLGKTEDEIVRNIEVVVPQIVQLERAARTALLEKDRARLEDRTWRAYGMLRHARMVTTEEALTMLSALRMGIDMGVIPKISMDALNELFVFSQPAHLQKMEGRELEAAERDAVRAAYLRRRLEEAERN